MTCARVHACSLARSQFAIEAERDALRQQQQQEMMATQKSLARVSSFNRQKIIMSSNTSWQDLLRSEFYMVMEDEPTLPKLRPQTSQSSVRSGGSRGAL